jgi:hypothetical protein
MNTLPGMQNAFEPDAERWFPPVLPVTVGHGNFAEALGDSGPTAIRCCVPGGIIAGFRRQAAYFSG